MLTQERLKQVFSYDQETGVFTRLIATSNQVRAGEMVGSLTTAGYLQAYIDRKNYTLHRLAWFYVYGVWPNQIDHINGIKDDNRISNLRSVTRSVNMQNLRDPCKDNKTGFLGVTISPTGTYEAQIHIKGKRKYIGRFKTPEEAHQAYLNAKRELHEGCTI